MKKTLAILLSLALVICMIPATAFGDTTNATADVKLKSASGVYDGTAHNPVVESVTVNGQVLATGWSINWNNGGLTNKGTYTGTVSGSYSPEGGETVNYTGTVTYEITALNLADAGVKITEKAGKPITSGTVTADNIDVTYNGKAITAGFEVTSAVSTSDSSTVLVTIKAADNQTNLYGSKTEAFYIRTAFDNTYAVKASGSYTYKGEAIKPTLTFTKGNSTIYLKEGTDYNVTYGDNVNAGPCVITVTGIGKYTGTIIGSFTISPKPISNVSITVPNVVQNGTISPVVMDGTKTLVKGTDYTYVEPNTSAAGSRTLEVTGCGNYTGTKSASYNVVDSSKVFDSSNVTAGTATPYYNGSKQYQTITVKIGNTTLRNGTDYKVEYTKDGKTNSYAEDAGSYVVTITGIGSYSGSATEIFHIRQVPLDYAEIVLGSSTVLYNGVYVPKVTVKHINGSYSFKESDYNVSYYVPSTITSWSKPYVTVTPKDGGNLVATATTSKLEKEFSLASRSLSNCTVTFTDSRSSKNYDGNASFKPPVTVKDYSLNRTLTENLDYKITYKDAAGKVVYALKDAGTYSVIVEGINAYTGTKTLTFTINGTDISGYTVTLKEASVNATGYAQTPVITSVKKGYYYSLTANDYTVSYQDSTGKTVTSMSAPGTYKVVVTGKNGYSGSTYATFRIVGLPQTVTVTQDSYKVYATSDSFKITAKASGDATGFTYTSSNPAVASVSSTGYVTMHKVGRAVITVTATGMKKYDPASTTVEVKVYPKKGYITKKPWTDGKKYQAKVRWTYQDGATSYQVKYSRDKNFGAGTYKIKTVKAHGKDYTTQSTTLKSLKSKSTYYIKVRAVYKDPVTGDTYYGAWSGWRSVKTK